MMGKKSPGRCWFPINYFKTIANLFKFFTRMNKGRFFFHRLLRYGRKGGERVGERETEKGERREERGERREDCFAMLAKFACNAVGLTPAGNALIKIVRMVQ